MAAGVAVVQVLARCTCWAQHSGSFLRARVPLHVYNQDMIENGKSMMEILVAAGWLAPGSHRSYSDRVWLEMAACMEAHDALTSAIAD